jgi:GntR family transcriptional regulator
MVEETSAKTQPAQPLGDDGEAPAWVRLRRRLMAEALAWRDPARRFHSEAEIAARFSVSRVTVRRALAALEAGGVLRRVRGSGSFVRPPTLAEHLTPTMELDKGWRASGHVSLVRVLACRRLRADAAAAAAFNLARGAGLLFIKRVRSLDGVPVAIDERLVPAGIAAACGLDASTASGSIIRQLWTAGPLDNARWTIEARRPAAEEAMLLGIPPDQPVLVRHMAYVDARGRTVLTGCSVHRGDMMRYALTLPLEPPRAAEEMDEAPMRAEVAG